MKALSNKNKEIFIILISLFFVESCVFEGEYKDIDTVYSIGYADNPKARNVFCYSEGVFKHEYLIAVDWNESYIVAKTCDYFTDSIRGYYFIDRKEYAENRIQAINPGLIGPYDSLEFFNEKEKYGFPNKFRHSWE